MNKKINKKKRKILGIHKLWRKTNQKNKPKKKRNQNITPALQKKKEQH